MILHFYNFGKSETIGSGKRFQKRDVYSSVLDSCLSRNLHRKPDSELIHSFVNRWSWENMFRSFASNRPSFPSCTTFHKHKMTYTRKRSRHLIGNILCPFEILWIWKEVRGLPPSFLIKTHGAKNFAKFNHFKTFPRSLAYIWNKIFSFFFSIRVSDTWYSACCSRVNWHEGNKT